VILIKKRLFLLVTASLMKRFYYIEESRIFPKSDRSLI